ncbi:hypothetical protein Tco_1109206 [Tanacetum coccineum]
MSGNRRYDVNRNVSSWMSTLVFVDPESFTQADEAQSSRVPMPLPEDPYYIRSKQFELKRSKELFQTPQLVSEPRGLEMITSQLQGKLWLYDEAYLDGTDTESEPFEDPIDTETLESPLTISPPIPLSESTLPVLVLILRGTARMVVRVLHAMLSDLSASMVGVAAMFESALRKRFRSSYDSSPSVSPPDLPSRKCYRITTQEFSSNAKPIITIIQGNFSLITLHALSIL